METFEFRSVDQSLRRYQQRLVVLAIIISGAFFIVLLRLLWLQVVSSEKYQSRAENNRVYVVPVEPLRGEIHAANDAALAFNEPVYTLNAYPAKVKQLRALVDDLGTVVRLSESERANFFRLAKDYKGIGGLPIKVKLSPQEIAAFAGQSYRFPNVEFNATFLRNYPYAESTSHILGYLATLSKSDQSLIDKEPGASQENYQSSSLFGRAGLERQYEFKLRGNSGAEVMEVDSFGRPHRRLKLTPGVPGKTLILSINLGLQKVANEALAGRRGAAVALEPSTGRVLALVSSPGFDANHFTGGIGNEEWDALNNSPDRPLLNRATAGTYPPGSTFKPFMAVAALDSELRKPSDITYDPGYFQWGNVTYRDFVKKGHGAVDLFRSIVESCDTYYYKLAYQMGINKLDHYADLFGFGRSTGIDLPGEVSGLLPTPAWKKKRFAGQPWYEGDTIPLGVGQGYQNYTPLQLAVAVAALANGGMVHTPRLLDSYLTLFPRSYEPAPPSDAYPLPFEQKDIEFVRNAMAGVNKTGTAASAFAGAPYTSAGKTGTAQVFSLKGKDYVAGRVKEHLRDHALYIGFAPTDKPRIALAVVVENAGFGGSSAAPVARKMMDYYLRESYVHP